MRRLNRRQAANRFCHALSGHRRDNCGWMQRNQTAIAERGPLVPVPQELTSPAGEVAALQAVEGEEMHNTFRQPQMRPSVTFFATALNGESRFPSASAHREAEWSCHWSSSMNYRDNRQIVPSHDRLTGQGCLVRPE